MEWSISLECRTCSVIYCNFKRCSSCFTCKVCITFYCNYWSNSVFCSGFSLFDFPLGIFDFDLRPYCLICVNMCLLLLFNLITVVIIPFYFYYVKVYHIFCNIVVKYKVKYTICSLLYNLYTRYTFYMLHYAITVYIILVFLFITSYKYIT